MLLSLANITLRPSGTSLKGGLLLTLWSKYILDRKTLVSRVWIVMVFLLISQNEIANSNTAYREKVFLHIDRKFYITGEALFYKAYCVNATSPGQPVHSAILYIELVGPDNSHVLGQILHLRNGTAQSGFRIPDTLASGQYFMKAYTSWMRNFNSQDFFSAPIIIYNAHNGKEILVTTSKPDIQVHLEGGELIEGVTNRLIIRQLRSIEDKKQAFIVNRQKEMIVSTAEFNDRGIGIFDLNPEQHSSYYLTYDSAGTIKTELVLPTIRPIGYMLRILQASEKKVILEEIMHNMPREEISLVATKGEQEVHKQKLSFQDGPQVIEIDRNDLGTGFLRFDIKNNTGEIYASSYLYIRQPVELTISSNEKAGTRKDINVRLSLSDTIASSNLSVSVARQHINPLTCNNGQSLEEFIQIPLASDAYICIPCGADAKAILPLYDSWEKKERKVELRKKTIFPIEEKGVVITGMVKSIESGEIRKDAEVLLAFKDTLPQVQSSVPNDDGKFAFIIDEEEAVNGLFLVVKDNENISDACRVEKDEKFFYKTEGTDRWDVETIYDSSLIAFMEESVQRSNIQKLFRKDELISGQPQSTSVNDFNPFLNNPDRIIYPHDYIPLQNFEEICRELIPEVKYVKRKTGYKLTMQNLTNGIKFSDPLILINGIPIYSIGKLHFLHSDLIERIEIQDHERVVGNLSYKGLIAITLKNEKDLIKVLEDEYGSFRAFEHISPPVKYNPVIADEGRKPDFRSQLYWDADITMMETNEVAFHFVTSDEEGIYLIEVHGLDMAGVPFSVSKQIEIGVK